MAVVDQENKVSIRTVKVGDRVGSSWIIADGLKPGERVVAEGVQKCAPGCASKPEALCVWQRDGAGKVEAMSKFFINRPIVAIVISIVMVIVGSLTIRELSGRVRKIVWANLIQG